MKIQIPSSAKRYQEDINSDIDVKISETNLKIFQLEQKMQLVAHLNPKLEAQIESMEKDMLENLKNTAR